MSNPFEEEPRFPSGPDAGEGSAGEEPAEKSAERAAAEGSAAEAGEAAEKETSTIFSDPTVEEKRPGMAPKKRAMIALACVAVLAVAGTGIALKLNAGNPGEEGQSEAESRAETIYVVNRAIDTVSGVEITNEKERYTLTPKAGESSGSIVWQLQGYEDLEMSSASSVASAAASLSAQRRIDEPGELSRYGMENPYSRVVVSVQDGEPYTITVGDQSPDQSGRYATVSGDGAVYLIDNATAELFTKPSTELISSSTFTPLASSGDDDPYFLNGELSYFDRITLGGTVRKSPIALECAEESILPYLITEPERKSANSDMVSALLTSASSGISNKGAYVYHPGTEDFQKYGLDNPYSTLVMKFGDRTITIRLGTQTESGYYPMTVDSKPVIYRVAESSVEWAGYTERDLYYDSLYIENVANIASLEYKTPERSILFTLTRDEEKNTYTAQAEGKTFASDEFAPYYRRLIELSAEEYLDGEPPEGELALQFTITYTDTERSPDVIRLLKYSDRRYLYQLNGKGSALVSATRVEELIEYVDWLLEGKAIPSLY